MSRTVFLADDRPVLRDGLRPGLATQADLLVVGEATDGREAVPQVAGLHFRVSILDIARPELNGSEAARQIRDARPWQSNSLIAKVKDSCGNWGVFPSNCQDFLTDRRDISLKLITGDQDLG
jgi:DNA-binding NarL/FixJ family response regulator